MRPLPTSKGDIDRMKSIDEKFNNLVIPVHKSAGLSTYDVIRRFRKKLRIKKIGHSGTLDPPATGLVLLLTGAATKLSGYLMDLPKRYVADIMLGSATDTQDASGKKIRTGDWSHVTPSDVERAIESLTGARMQVPPMYSALKHRGTPLYTLARRGQEVEREPREVNIYEMKLIENPFPSFRIEIHCSRGMYVRVLAEEIGDLLGVPAHLDALVRTEIGHFTLESAVKDDDFDSLPSLEKPGYTLSEALQHFPAVELDARQARGLDNGISPRMAAGLPSGGGLVRLLRPDGRLGAIAETGSSGLLVLRKVFPVS